MPKYEEKIWKKVNTKKVHGIDGKLNIQDTYFLVKLLNDQLKGEDKYNNHDYIKHIRNKLSYAVDVSVSTEQQNNNIVKA